MIKEAFQRGFINAAISSGVDYITATQLCKQAESSGIGRYFAEKAIAGQGFIDRPMTSQLAGLGAKLPFVLGGGALGGPMGARVGSNIADLGGIPEAAAALGVSGNKKDRSIEYKKSLEGLKDRGYGASAWHNIKKMAPLTTAVGALAGGAGVPMMEQAGQLGNLKPSWSGALHGAEGGALAGLIGGGIGGGLSGLLNKFTANHTSDETQDRALKMKANHPFSTALPFGDMAGAANG